MSPLVVKLGGSHALDALLPVWMAAIAAAAHPVLVVPGGGPFADAVRAAQGPMGFSDRAAHRMAILAMAQYAEALADRFGLPLVRRDESARTIAGAAVWSPLDTAYDDGTLPATWDLSSDSIAAWLARRIDATALVLIKRTLPPHVETFAQAIEAGLVDPLFATMIAGFDGPVWIAGPQAQASFAALVGNPDATALPGLARLGVQPSLRRAG